MNLEDAIDLGVFVVSIAAIGIGVGCAVSAAWASVVVGGLMAVAVIAERITLRLVGPKKGKPDEPA